MAGGGGGPVLEYTPTWIVVAVCSVIVAISLIFVGALEWLGEYLKEHKFHRFSLYDVVLKLKEELMLLGFISLLLVVFQGQIQKICILRSLTKHFLPCKYEEKLTTTGHYTSFVSSNVDGDARRHLAGGGAAAGSQTYCEARGKKLAKDLVPLLSLDAIHQIHIFIFVLAMTHVVLSMLTVLLGIIQIRRWKSWEEEAVHDEETRRFFVVKDNHFFKKHFRGHGKFASVLSWLISFFRQFRIRGIEKEDYRIMRISFIQKHVGPSQKYNFYNYVIRSLEEDFVTVITISLPFWIFVMVFLLLNVNGWNAYFWMSFVPLALLLLFGTKMEHILTELAKQVVEKCTVIEGTPKLVLSDQYFWFDEPRLILFVLHFCLFQIAFEMSYFFWILFSYGFNSCIMGKLVFIVTRLVICVVVQILCSYSTLPLYAIVCHMGTMPKSSIVTANVREAFQELLHEIKKEGERGTATEMTSRGSRHGNESELPIRYA